MSTSTGEERSALFGSSARVQLRQAVKAPKGVTAAAASGFLGVMATAYYALTKAARIQQGDWVLIHVGFALSKVDEEEAIATRKMLEGMGEDYESELEELKASVIE